MCILCNRTLHELVHTPLSILHFAALSSYCYFHRFECLKIAWVLKEFKLSAFFFSRKTENTSNFTITRPAVHKLCNLPWWFLPAAVKAIHLYKKFNKNNITLNQQTDCRFTLRESVYTNGKNCHQILGKCINSPKWAQASIVSTHTSYQNIHCHINTYRRLVLERICGLQAIKNNLIYLSQKNENTLLMESWNFSRQFLLTRKHYGKQLSAWLSSFACIEMIGYYGNTTNFMPLSRNFIHL